MRRNSLWRDEEALGTDREERIGHVCFSGFRIETITRGQIRLLAGRTMTAPKRVNANS